MHAMNKYRARLKFRSFLCWWHKIQTMTDEHSSALCIAADRIARTESALDRMHIQESETSSC